MRDASSGVPHIYGRTRSATFFAEGYTTAEDRLLFMDVLRHVGRGRLAELVGAPGSARDLDALRDAPYTEDDLEAQLEDLKQSGTDGATIVADLEAYTDGVNAFLDDAAADPSLLPAEYALLGKEPAPWKTTDAVAIAANIGGIFGRGGGRELDNLCGLRRLEERLGNPVAARAVFDAVHLAEDPGAPTTSRREAPYGADALPDPAAVPDLDCASLVPVGGYRDPVEAAPGGLGAGPGPLAPDPAWLGSLLDLVPHGEAPAGASNAVLVGAEHAEGDRPIAVFGPQVGYSVPELLVEKDVHGPDIDARGVGFLGIDLYVLLGRGRDFAWSATSAGADNVDTFVLALCDPAGGDATVESTGYEHDGACQPIESYDHVVETTSGLGAGDPVTLTWTIERTADYGPISHRGRLRDGTPVAVASKRSTYGAEIRSAIGFKQLNDPGFMDGGFDAFREAVGEGVDYTFNWFYVDATTIGYQHSCRCPVRAAGVDPDLPAWGTGEWDWESFLAPEDQPFDVNPEEGWITSWNNKPAPGFRASDDQFSYGPVHRVDLLNTRLATAVAGGERLDRAAVVDIVMDAATVDLRGQEVLPLVLEVMGTDAPAGVDPRLLDVRERLEVWASQGAHRLDRDRDGAYDDPQAPAILDAWWPLLVGAVLGEAAGHPFETLGLPIENHPRSHGGSSWLSGAYGQVERDLRSITQGSAPDSGTGSGRAHCGGGDLAACRAALWTSLDEAAGMLEAEFASPDVDAWQRVPADDEIRYSSLLVGLPPMHWVNRPTFQQVVQLESRGQAREPSRPSDDGDGDRDGGDGDGDGVARNTAIAVGAAVGVAAGLALAFRRRRR
ncbi:MAG: penicillin acylase family protein [Acidimicrobiia bacterium]|nr:penicillin acylase family protein [Acidimicrobiia bacterium]